MSHRLFGTDGVRGKAGEHPLDHETVARLGGALVRAMRSGGRPLRFIAGRDTRESGE
jgi:phosphoglucosamine mutase